MARYTTVLLDADETLFDFRRAEREALCKTLTERGIAPSPEIVALYREINERLWRQFERGEIGKAALQRERFCRLFERLGLPEDAACNEAYLGHLGEGAYLLPGAEALCRALAPHARLYLATNGISRTQAARLERSAIRPFISRMFVSEDVGYQKPDPRYFDAVFAALRLPDRSGAVMLGDSLCSDMRGAKNAGIAACWFCPDPAAGPGDVPIDYRIARLEEFVPIVLGTELPL